MDLAYMTALRIGDLLTLKMGDIEDQWIVVRQQKNEVRGRYLLTPEMRETISAARSLRRSVGTVYILAKKNGQPYSYYGFVSIFRRACERAQVNDVHFHDIRAKAVTDWKNAGGDPQALSLHGSRSQAEAYVKAHGIPEVMPLKRL